MPGTPCECSPAARGGPGTWRMGPIRQRQATVRIKPHQTLLNFKRGRQDARWVNNHDCATVANIETNRTPFRFERVSEIKRLPHTQTRKGGHVLCVEMLNVKGKTLLSCC